MHGATLQDIALEVDALSTIDIARVQWMLTAHADSRSFKDSIGVISVNYDTVDEHVKQGRRLDKDAEIQALCLLIYWTEAQPFIDIASDLVIKYVHAGCGSSGKAYTLRLINLEESKRKVRIASMIWKPILFRWCCKGSCYFCVVLLCFDLLCIICFALHCFALCWCVCFAFRWFALHCIALLCFALFALL